MSLDVVDAVKSGFDRLGTRNAVIIASMYFILNILNTSISDTLVSKFVSSMPGSTGFLIIPLIAASALLGVAALRLFATNERDVIPRAHYRENIGKPVLNVLVGGVAFGVILAAAFLVPLIPAFLASFIGSTIAGIAAGLIGVIFSFGLMVYLLIKLYFWTAAVAIDNQNFVEGFKTSWKLTEDDKLNTGLLLLSIVTISLILGVIFSIPSLIGLTVVGAITTSIGSAIAGTLTAAILASAYLQLKSSENDIEEEEDSESENNEETEEDTESEDDSEESKEESEESNEDDQDSDEEENNDSSQRSLGDST